MPPTVTEVPAGQATAAVLPLVPFVRAATELVESANIDRSNAISANSIQLGPDDIPARGYLRNLLILVEATGGTGSAAVYKEDAPWSVISEIALQDVNGANIYGPISGYDAFLVHKWGGYGAFDNPVSHPKYVAPTTAGNFTFLLRVPVEINSRDAVGSLGNRNASSTYKLRITQAAKGSVYSTDPTGLPTVRIRVYSELWSQPAPVNGMGQPQAVQPPAHGTTQFWSKTTKVIAAGQQNIRLDRVGNLIRALIFVFRTTTPARSDTNFPSPFTLAWESQQVVNVHEGVQKGYMVERYGHATIDTGVYVVDYAHDFDGRMGGELRDGWLPTTQATRFELSGSFGAAGTLDILTNDVAPAGDVYAH